MGAQMSSDSPVKLTGINTQRDSGIAGLPADFGMLDTSIQDNQTENYNNLHDQFQN
jgi:hypothetical protein